MDGQSEVLHADQGNEVRDVYPLSWIPYARLILLSPLTMILFILIGYVVAVIFANNNAKLANAIIIGFFVLSFFSLAYRWMELRSVALVINDDGVWVEQGVMAWEKRYAGVKWVDISEAGFKTGFASWACKSFSVIVGHRFTHGAEIVLDNVKQGDQAVTRINQVLMRLHRIA